MSAKRATTKSANSKNGEGVGIWRNILSLSTLNSAGIWMNSLGMSSLAECGLSISRRWSISARGSITRSKIHKFFGICGGSFLGNDTYPKYENVLTMGRFATRLPTNHHHVAHYPTFGNHYSYHCVVCTSTPRCLSLRAESRSEGTYEDWRGRCVR